MSNNLLINKDKTKSQARIRFAFSVLILLALSVAVGIFATTAVIDESASNDVTAISTYIPADHAGGPAKKLKDFMSVDVTKLTKDSVAKQPTPADIDSIVAALSQLNVRYVAISVPMDSNADFIANKVHPAPQTVENFTKTWADAIHAHGMLVLWRGTFSGVDGLYGFTKRVSSTNRLPTGNYRTAPTDGQTTWLGKTYSYIVKHPTYFHDGDIWAPMPDETTNISQDSTSFLSYTGGIRSNYAWFYSNLRKASIDAFTAINKPAVYTGWSSNNFSEANSGWLTSTVNATTDVPVVVDYYGTSHTPTELLAAMVALHARYNRQIFIQEWSDPWTAGLTETERQAYDVSMYAIFNRLSDSGVLMGFNYQGGWAGDTESILDKTPTGYVLNSRGQQLKTFISQVQVQLHL